MVVWGGIYSNTGGQYDPVADSWTTTTTTNAPVARSFHTAVWTGSKMVVWGGENSTTYNSGAAYNPTTDSWTATSLTNVPSARYGHLAVWLGTRMMIWGGLGAGGNLPDRAFYYP